MQPEIFAVYKGHSYFKDNTIVSLESPQFVKSGKRVISKLIDKTASILVKPKNKELFKEISKCKGDITKCKYYHDSKVTLDYLLVMSRNGNGGCKKYLNNVAYVHEYILKNQTIIKKIAATNDHVGNQFWLSLYAFFFASVSIALAYSVEVKSGVVRWRKEDKIGKSYVAKKTEEIVDAMKSHKIDEAMKKIVNHNNVGNESPVILLVAVLGGALLLIYFARFIVMMFLQARVSIADWLKNQGSFVKMIASNNSRIDDTQRAKQESDAVVLEKVAEKIDVDLNNIEGETKEEIENENKAVMIELQKENSESENVVESVSTEGNTTHSASISGMDF